MPMFGNFVYFILAALGFGFLIFIHELGHYFMARRVGMTVEVFSIGFGKPIKSWVWKGVRWQLCWLPFGGYVRIAGTEKKGNLEPHQIPDGYFGKRPIDRIKVSAMGPIVNIVFAFVAFALIWMSGGREKSFREYTHRIGWIDPHSRLYELGVRPGDEITEYNHRPIEGFVDLVYGSLRDGKEGSIKGAKVDYAKGGKEPFAYQLPTYRDAAFIDSEMPTIGVIAPAYYLIFQSEPEDLSDTAPLRRSGIQKNDRILSIDGQLIFSLPQLITIVNDPKTLLTVSRKGQIFQTRVPRLKVSDLRMGESLRSELQDWQHEAQLKGKLAQLYFIPYDLSSDRVVQDSLPYFDQAATEHVFKAVPRSAFSTPLERGDQILAVDGVRISNADALLAQLQKRELQIIVERGLSQQPVSWKQADQAFSASIDWQSMQQIVQSIGTEAPITHAGPLYLLSPVEPQPAVDYPLTVPTKKAKFSSRWEAQEKEIQKIEDPKLRQSQLDLLEREKKVLRLGLDLRSLRDQPVIYNPSPFILFGDVLDQTWQTISALFSGLLNPKMLQGPVGIFQVMQYGWSQGINEALYWMGLISINLGILNLLPVPVLDGGYICFSLWEIVTKRRVRPKTIERMLIPFLILLIGFMLFVTYHDILRLFS